MIGLTIITLSLPKTGAIVGEFVSKSKWADSFEGYFNGIIDGISDGCFVGYSEGVTDGVPDGVSEGVSDGCFVGRYDGTSVGISEGISVGSNVGNNELVLKIVSLSINDPNPPKENTWLIPGTKQFAVSLLTNGNLTFEIYNLSLIQS